MPGVAPQAAVHDPTGVGRVGLESGQLGITDGPEGEADQPDGYSGHGQRAEPGLAANLAELYRQKDHPHQGVLQPEHVRRLTTTNRLPHRRRMA